MALKDFQHACLELTLRPDTRQALAQGELVFVGLSASEKEDLKQLGAEFFEAQSQAHQALQMDTLRQLTPYSVRKLLGADHVEQVLTQMQYQDSLPPAYDHRAQLSAFLHAVLDFLRQQQLIIPHLWDAVQYELTAARLSFFRLPNSEGQREGPLLSRAAQVIELGPHFPQVLKQLRQGLLGSKYSEVPKQSFLMLRDFQGLILEPVSELLAQCLQACQGRRSWEALSQELLAQAEQSGLDEESLRAEAKTLQTAYGHYIKRGVLLDRQG